ncbi:MAG: CHRD domain-containing protein, partial [Pyrinomonadaceae bacterium]|nr:CHRD domain-containing protein [Pyrinomonadaceae bacterium]
MKKIFNLMIAAAVFAMLSITATAQQVYIANLSGAQVAPANGSPATGVARVTLNPAETQITVNVTYSGLLSNANAGHIHGPAAIGVNAGILFGLAGVTGTSGTLNQTYAITAAQVQQMRSGLHYLDIHTTGFPGGEIRGQLKLANKVSDFDGEGKADIAVWRANVGIYFILQSLTNSNRVQQWGVGSDFPVPMDYDGDGRTDLNIIRPGDNGWYILQSSNNTLRVQQWGSQNQFDFPVPADYDGDGTADLAVYRGINATWYILQSATNSLRAERWGVLSFMPDTPVPGDYDRDGKTDLAVFRPSNNTWYVQQSSNGSLLAQQFGATGDRVVPQDYDADGRTDFAVWRPSTG